MTAVGIVSPVAPKIARGILTTIGGSAEPGKLLAGKRICVVGGSDLHLRIPFLLRLRQAGLEVAAVGTGSEEPFDRHQLPFVRYRMKRAVHPLADVLTFTKLRRWFKLLRPTIVHAFDTKPSIYAIWAARQAKVPVRIRTITGRGSVFVSKSLTYRLLGLLLIKMHRSAAACAQITAFYNQEDLHFAISCQLAPPGKTALVPGSGIDVAAFLDQIPPGKLQQELREQLAAGDGPVVMMISRLLREKGVIEYLEAARLIRKQLPQTRFYLVGSIEPAGRNTLQPQEILAFREDVSWLGQRADVPALLNVADLVVLPTYYGEGIPRVILEAGACGRPVLATEVAGCVDVIEHGRNGWLVRPRDAVALAEAIGLLLGDRNLRQRLGENLRQDVNEQFSLDRILEIWLRIYAECLVRTSTACS